METVEINMTLRIPRAASETEAREALRLAESAFQNALGNSVDAEFDYDEAVTSFGDEKLELDIDDIEDDDEDDEDEDDSITHLNIDATSAEHFEAIEALLGKKRSTQYHTASNRIIFDIDPDDDDLSEIEDKLGKASDKVGGFSFS